MALLRQLLLIPLLAPLLAVMLVGALNPRPSLSLRLLIWTTPSLPIGIWLLIASGGGGLVSAAATGLALRSPTDERTERRQVRRPFRAEAPAWEGAAPRARPDTGTRAGSTGQAWDAGPSRPPGEPPPTVAVPFRVIRTPVDRPVAAAAAEDDWERGSTEDW